jgi:hypothetical protein
MALQTCVEGFALFWLGYTGGAWDLAPLSGTDGATVRADAIAGVIAGGGLCCRPHWSGQRS